MIDKNKYNTNDLNKTLKRKISTTQDNNINKKRRTYTSNITSDIYKNSGYSRSVTHNTLCYNKNTCHGFNNNCSKYYCNCILCLRSNIQTLNCINNNINRFVYVHKKI